MTELQKQNVSVLRARGLSFGQIAAEVDLSVNTVKSFCRRVSLQSISASKDSESKDIIAKEQGAVCKSCGKPLIRLPKAKPRQFCCDACRIRWWNAQRGSLSDRQGMTPKACAHCGALFVSYQSMNRRFCSHRCYVRARFYEEARV